MIFSLQDSIKIKDYFISFHLIYGLYFLVEFVRSYVFFSEWRFVSFGQYFQWKHNEKCQTQEVFYL